MRPVAATMPGVSPADRSPVPSPSTPQGGSRRYVLEEVIATNGAAGSFTRNVAMCRITIPSVRLAAKLSICYRPFGAEDFDFPQSGTSSPPWLGRLDEWVRTSKGLYLRGGNIFNNLALPFSWEAETISDEWRLRLTAPLEHDPGEGNIPGTGLNSTGQVWAVAQWEPAPRATIDDGELATLFQSCRLVLDQGIGTFTGNA